MKTLTFTLLVTALVGCAAPALPPSGPVQLTLTPDAEFRARPPALAPVPMLKAPAVSARELENGLTLWVVERPDLPLVSVVYANRAAFDRDAASVGLSSLVVETLRGFRSAEQQPSTAYHQTLERILSREGTMLRLTTTSDRFTSALKRLADAVRRPLIDEQAVQAAKRSVANQSWNSGIQVLNSLRGRVLGSLYGRTELLGLPIDGTSNSIQARTTGQVRSFYDRHYVPSQSLIVVVGAIQAVDAERQVRGYFQDWDGAKRAPESLPSPTISATPTSAVGISRAESRAFIAVGLPCTGSADPDNVVFDVIATLLGRGLGSRVAASLRHDEGHTTASNAACYERTNSGDFIASIDADPEHTGRAVSELLTQLRRLHTETTSEAEVQTSARAWLGEVADRMTTNAHFAQTLASLFLRKQPANYYDTLEARVLSVDPERLRRVAEKYFRLAEPKVAIYGDAQVIQAQLAPVLPVTWESP